MFPCLFPVPTQIFPVPIFMICDYYIHKTDLADLSSFKTKLEIFAANIEISFTFRISEFTTWANQISYVLAKISNSLCFPWQFFFFIFPVFPVQWVPCWRVHNICGLCARGAHKTKKDLEHSVVFPYRLSLIMIISIWHKEQGCRSGSMKKSEITQWLFLIIWIYQNITWNSPGDDIF